MFLDDGFVTENTRFNVVRLQQQFATTFTPAEKAPTDRCADK
jgi:hypothetical protein